jgi:hypothetical protein
MESEGSFLFSQESATGLYPEPHEYNHYSPPSKFHFNINLPLISPLQYPIRN